MNITMEELREIKHALPTGSVRIIAEELALPEQTVRNYFGAKKYQEGTVADLHVQPGPKGGIVHVEDVRIIDMARKMINNRS